MADKTAAARNAKLRERKRAAGLVPVTVMVPEARKEELKRIAAKMRNEDERIDDARPDHRATASLESSRPERITHADRT